MSPFPAHARFTRILSQTVLIIALSCLTGCDAWFSGLLPRLGPLRLVGEDGDKVFLVARVNEEETIIDNLFRFVPAERDLVSLDLVTRDVATQLSLVGAAARDVRVNQDWIVWIDRIEQTLKVLDREADTTTTYFENDDHIGAGDYLQVLDGDRLLMHRINRQIMDAAIFNCVVLNLRTTDQTIVTDLWFKEVSALKGDWLAIMNDKNITVELLGLELAANIDLINIATSERQQIAGNLRVSGDGTAALFIDDGKVIWQEYKEGGFSAKISAYDITDEETSTLVDDFDPEGQSDGEATLVDARDRRLLVTRSHYNFFGAIPNNLVIEIWPLETLEPIAIAQHDSTQASGQIWYEPEPRFVSDFAFWTEPTTGNLKTYNLFTGDMQEFELPLQ